MDRNGDSEPSPAFISTKGKRTDMGDNSNDGYSQVTRKLMRL